jgi:hypothetical protein
MTKVFTTFDSGTTTIDKSYTFTVEARDQYGFSAVTKDFTINVTTPNETLYSNLSIRPFLPEKQREMFKSFVNDSLIFTPGSIYRPNDPDFGIQYQLKMIAFAGIETKEAAAFVGAMGLNHKKKRFQVGSIKKAYAVKTGTNEVIYEVIYLDMIDPLEPNDVSLDSKFINTSQDPNTITVDSANDIWSRDPAVIGQTDDPFGFRPDPRITIDQTNLEVSDPNTRASFPNSISNWRSRLKNFKDDAGNFVFATERNYLPLWMRSIQPGTKNELGFVLGIPICFCLPGKADDILLNIKYSGFDFSMLDYTVDRYIIDAVEGYSSDKYIVFKNDRNTLA